MGARVMLTDTVDDPESSSYEMKATVESTLRLNFPPTHLVLLGDYRRLNPILDAVLLGRPVHHRLDALLRECVE
jgi:hypothetical protein